MRTMVVDDFFNNFSAFKDEFKKITRYRADQHSEVDDNAWRGERSEDLTYSNKFLASLFINEFNSKFNNFLPDSYAFKLYTHLYLKKDEKMIIHKDSSHPTYAAYSMLVYLSDTNLESGTALYGPTEKDLITDIKFVQNRAVIYDSNYLHAAISNYGDNEDNGRLTLNTFWFKKKGDR